jgi:hypothetical protein
MADFGLDLEIIQDGDYALKAPKGFKGSDWTSKSGRPGRVLYEKHSPDYDSSTCYITVSTVARDPLTDEVRRRIEKHLGEDGFSFSFEEVNGRHVVFYSHEAETDYKTYHAIVILSHNKAVMMDVVFNAAFDNSATVAKNIMSSIHPNFPLEATEEEVKTDMARFKAEDEAEEAKQAAKKAQLEAAQGTKPDKAATPVDDARAQALDMLDKAEQEVATAVRTVVESADENLEVVDAEIVEEEEAEVVEEAQDETPVKPNFDNTENGKEKSLIYDTVAGKGKITLSELQSIPGLVDLGRMDITRILNSMIRDDILIRIEDADNIYFGLPGSDKEPEAPKAGNGPNSALTPEEQYKIDMERYELAMKQWKKSKRGFGKKATMEKPVEPEKPASMR